MQDDALNHSSMEDDVWVPKFELNEEKMIIDLSPAIRLLTNHIIDLIPISFRNRNLLVLILYLIEVLLVGIFIWLFAPNAFGFLSEILKAFSLEILTYPLTALALTVALDLALGLTKMLLTWALVLRSKQVDRERLADQILNYANGYRQSDPTKLVNLCENGKCPKDLADAANNVFSYRGLLVSKLVQACEMLLSDRFFTRVQGYIFLSNLGVGGIAAYIRCYRSIVEDFAMLVVKVSARESICTDSTSEIISEEEMERKKLYSTSETGLVERLHALERKIDPGSPKP